MIAAATLGSLLFAPPVEIRWVAPPQCPDAVALTADVERFLGRKLDAQALDEPLVFDVDVTEGDLWTAEIEILSGDDASSRVLEDESCRVLQRGVAFVIATTVDPDVDPSLLDSALDETEAMAEEKPSTPAPAPREPIEPSAEASGRGGMTLRRSQRPTIPLRYALGVDFVGNLGGLPSFAPGLGLGGALLIGRHARFEVAGAWLFDRPVRIPQDSEVGGDIRVVSGAVRGCGVPTPGPVEIPLCGGFQGGVSRGAGVGLDRTAVTRLPWLALDLEAGLGWAPVRRFALRFGIGAVVPLTQPVFTVDGVGTVFESSLIELQTRVGVELRIP